MLHQRDNTGKLISPANPWISGNSSTSTAAPIFMSGNAGALGVSQTATIPATPHPTTKEPETGGAIYATGTGAITMRKSLSPERCRRPRTVAVLQRAEIDLIEARFWQRSHGCCHTGAFNVNTARFSGNDVVISNFMVTVTITNSNVTDNSPALTTIQLRQFISLPSVINKHYRNDSGNRDYLFCTFSIIKLRPLRL